MEPAAVKPLVYLRDAAVFASCYVLLDWVSYIHPLGALNITPWNPQPALAITWMLLAGLLHAPAVFATIVLADVLIRDTPAGVAVMLASALALTLGYTALASVLRGLLRPRPALDSLRQLTLFVGVVVPGTALVAAAFIAMLAAAGALEAPSALPAWLRFWTGDAVGVLVTAPLLLAAADAERRRRLAALARRAESYAQLGAVAAALWLIFAGLHGEPALHFYLLFPPLIWVAVRSGMAGAIVALAIVQAGVVVGMHNTPPAGLPVIELQALVAALTLTGLYLGLLVDERARAAESLKQSLRLAAAGEMAGAIAHEVNQPLTALANYGRAGQMLMQGGRAGELGPVLEHMVAEAQRASEVVRRLRDFFRQGTTRLERVGVRQVLTAAAREAKSHEGVQLTLTADEGLPEILVDRLQIELVLRNLIANALDAVRGREPGAVAVRAARQDAAHVRIVVSDNGPGIAPADAERIFEPFVTHKPTGMGLGLAVSRAIVEAHGGRLDARAGAHGEFHLVLPVEAAHG